ncbi:hypothetical protein ACQJBY_009539 [Aegilops geniculata]
MATAATASAPASASTSAACNAPSASSSCPAAVCLVPFRWWAGVREEAAEEGGVRYAATPAASPSYYGLRLLHSFLHPDLVLRLDRGECRASATSGGSRSYALVPADELSRALARQNSSLALHNKHSFAEDSAGAYPLVLRISVRETSILTVKISKKDNPVDNYKRANKMFNIDSQPVHVWDFSGQTNLILMNEWNRSHQDYCHSEQEGELALAFGELLRSLWTNDRNTVAPHNFKAKIACFAPQFSGFNQHDSQELLAFLLDGLHEDLNQVKCKPYEEAKDASGRPDEEVADEYWRNHLARNDSVIVDTCHGQYKSTLTCPTCNKTSVTFDPFMYLSLPVPSMAKRTMTVTVFSTDGSREPFSYDVSVPKFGILSDLVQALSAACSLGGDESLLITEVYNNCIIRYLEEPSDSVSLLRDGDKLAAYRLPKQYEKSSLVVFTHKHFAEHSGVDNFVTPQMKEFEAPLLASLPEAVNGLTLQEIYLKLLNPFRFSKIISSSTDCGRGDSDCAVYSMDAAGDCAVNLMDTTPSSSDGNVHSAQLEDGPERNQCNDNSCEVMEGPSETYCGEADVSDKEAQKEQFGFYLTNERDDVQRTKIEMNDLDLLEAKPNRLHVSVNWQHSASKQYDVSMLNNLPEIHKLEVVPKGTEDSVALHVCLEAFLKEEPLGPEDMWYCPCCKKHQQAMKKLDLWRLPEVLVIHLKRFSYTQFTRNKLETFVDFPISDLDLSSYITTENEQPYNHYRLYAISSHYGNMGGGHYTASIYQEGKGWHKFDDECVTPISEDNIKTAAAYVLFYRRE